MRQLSSIAVAAAICCAPGASLPASGVDVSCFSVPSNAPYSVFVPIDHLWTQERVESVLDVISKYSPNSRTIWLETAPALSTDGMADDWSFPIFWRVKIRDRFYAESLFDLYGIPPDFVPALLSKDYYILAANHCAKAQGRTDTTDGLLLKGAIVRGLQVKYLEPATQMTSFLNQSDSLQKAEMTWAHLTKCSEMATLTAVLTSSIKSGSDVEPAVAKYYKSMSRLGAGIISNAFAMKRDRSLKEKIVSALHMPGTNVVFAGATHTPIELRRTYAPQELCGKR